MRVVGVFVNQLLVVAETNLGLELTAHVEEVTNDEGLHTRGHALHPQDYSAPLFAEVVHHRPHHCRDYDHKLKTQVGQQSINQGFVNIGKDVGNLNAFTQQPKAVEFLSNPGEPVL